MLLTIFKSKGFSDQDATARVFRYSCAAESIRIRDESR